jgi:FAD/FMN-containing dehydrogenase/Fe-S oxidoreductase
LTNNDIFDDLIGNVEGDVLLDKLSRYMLATDGSIYMREPACVVYPKSSNDVINVVKFAEKYGFSIQARGAGSGLVGSSIGKGIALDFTKYMNKVLSIDVKNQYFECEPGLRGGELKEKLKNTNLYFPPDPSSFDYATFGGMFSTNASGAHSSKYGNVNDYVLDAEIVLSDGSVLLLKDTMDKNFNELPKNFQDIYKLYVENEAKIKKSYPPVKSNVCGYNLRSLVDGNSLNLIPLFAGSEGTLGIVTKIKFKLVEKPSNEILLIAYFNNKIDTSSAVNLILPLNPAGIEIMDKSLLDLAKDYDPKLKDSIPDGIDNVLLCEFDGYDKNELQRLAENGYDLLVSHKLTNNIHIAKSEEEKESFWSVRKAAVPILYKLKGEKKIVALVEDAAIPPEKLNLYFDGVYNIFNKYHADFVIYGHIAKGLLHTRPLLNLKCEDDVNLLKILADEVFELVNSLNGTISGEHGDGRVRSRYAKLQYPHIYDLFVIIKKLIDPNKMLNPDIKIVEDDDLIQKNLRYGAQYKARDLDHKNLLWKEGFVCEIEKCHGCSKCTTIDTSVRMCPIYKFTRNEKASPKAKANILRGLISGAIDSRYMYEYLLQDIINQCVGCESCHYECPSNVNIPKLAAEAKSKYIERYGVPFKYHLLTNVDFISHYARKLMTLPNKIMSLYIARKVIEPLTHVSAERKNVPISYRSLYDRINTVEGNGDIRVLFFAGCYYSYIEPEVGVKSVNLLKNLGLTVVTPKQFCCGVPMVAKGMVNAAKGRIKKNIDLWGHLVTSVDYIIVSCSSCGLALMNEWSDIATGNIVNKIRDKTIHITNFLKNFVSSLELTDVEKTYAYHMPCHLKVQKSPKASITILNDLGIKRLNVLDSNCCGMAGSFGVLKENYDLSKKIGEELKEKVVESGEDTVITDCPACRMQLKEITEKNIIHPVELINVHNR